MHPEDEARFAAVVIAAITALAAGLKAVQADGTSDHHGHRGRTPWNIEL